MKYRNLIYYFFVLFICVKTISLEAADRNIELYFSPNKENETVVSNFIEETKSELLILAYSLTNHKIASSIKKVKQTKQVKLICDKANFKKKNDYCKSLGGKADKKFGLMHNKVMVRDKECVLTGSFNFTNNAVYNNRENFLIHCDKNFAEKYIAEFNKLERNNT